MAAYSHSTSPSLSALPISSTTSEPTPAIEVVPWVVYEYCAPEATTSRTTTSTGTSGSSSSQKVRVVGRGGFGSRPRRSKSVSFSNPGSDDAPPTAGRPITQKPLPKTPDEKSAVRVVGRGGAGSRPRNISAIQQFQDSSTSSTPSLQPPPETPRPIVVGGGRGGAGSRPRAFKQKEKKAHSTSSKWLEKGKAKLFPSNRYYGRPSSPCDSVDTGSVIFAPPPSRLVNTALAHSSSPSEHSIPCSIPSTPAATFASTASSSYLDSPVRWTKFHSWPSSRQCLAHRHRCLRMMMHRLEASPDSRRRLLHPTMTRHPSERSEGRASAFLHVVNRVSSSHLSMTSSSLDHL